MLGVQAYFNYNIGFSKFIAGSAKSVASFLAEPETGSASTLDLLPSLYSTVAGGGQAVMGYTQLKRAWTGYGGPETQLEQNAVLAQGPLSTVLILGSGFSKQDAERMANFESLFYAGSGLINAIGTGEIGRTVSDAGVTAAGVATAPCSH